MSVSEARRAEGVIGTLILQVEADGPRLAGSWATVARRFLDQPFATLSLALLCLLAAGSLLGGWLWPYDHAQITSDISSPPGWRHPMGTDGLGRDLFAQVLRGTQLSLRVGLVVAAASTALGTLVGALAGYYGRLVDSVLMRLTDVVLSVPALVLLAVMSRSARSVSQSWLAIALLMAALSWTGIARVVRSIVLSVRESEFIDAARAAGTSGSGIVFRHLLPHASGAMLVKASTTVGGAILAETTLSYLGLGIGPPDTSLGRLVDTGQQAISSRPWLFYFPGLVIMLIVLAVNVMGDGIRDALDPRQPRGQRRRRRR